MPVIYVCCFASVMRKQVNYHPHNSIYGPCVLYLYTKFEAGSSICSKNIKGSQNFEIWSRDPGHAHLGVVLWSVRTSAIYVCAKFEARL